MWVGLDEWLVKVSWLGKLALVFWWVELDLFSLSAVKCPVVSFCSLYIKAKGYVSVLLEN